MSFLQDVVTQVLTRPTGLEIREASDVTNWTIESFGYKLTCLLIGPQGRGLNKVRYHSLSCDHDFGSTETDFFGSLDDQHQRKIYYGPSVRNQSFRIGQPWRHLVGGATTVQLGNVAVWCFGTLANATSVLTAGFPPGSAAAQFLLANALGIVSSRTTTHGVVCTRGVVEAFGVNQEFWEDTR